MAEKIVVFGAGATGRGHVGLLAWQAGFEIVFVDKKPDLVEALAGRRAATPSDCTAASSTAGDRRSTGYRVYHYAASARRSPRRSSTPPWC